MGELIKHLASVEVEKRDGKIYILEVGDIIYHRGGQNISLEKVTKIQEEEYASGRTTIFVYTDAERNFSNGKRFEERKPISTVNEYYTVYKGDRDEIEQIAEKVHRGELSLLEFLPKKESNSTELMVMNKDFYTNALAEAERIQSKVAIIEQAIKNKIDAIKSKISGELAVFNGIVHKLKKIVFTLELYAGIGEDIIHINEGTNADHEEKIHIMQNMLFMDEEVGDPENGGISYKSVEQFYEWMRKFNKHLGYFNYELIVPYTKSVRVMRVRRQASERYTQDAFRNDYAIMQEMKTCIIIRNGSNVYVIHSQMHFKEKLFPSQEELEKVMKQTKGNVELLLEEFEDYRYGMVLIQGILDRTPYLATPNTLSVLKPNEQIVFEYDRLELNDGTMTFGKFLSTQHIEVGTRILALDLYSDRGRRFYTYSRYDDYPRPPDNGIYELIKHHDKDSNDLTISYVPDETVYNSKLERYVQRTKAVRFKIDKSDNICDIDLVSHKDLEWLEKQLYDRRDRKQYLHVVPMLNALKKYKAEEWEIERPFALLLCQQLKINEEIARDYIYWWKTKNKYKRALSKDDLKALRMIKKKYSKDLIDGTVMKIEPNIEKRPRNEYFR